MPGHWNNKSRQLDRHCRGTALKLAGNNRYGDINNKH